MQRGEVSCDRARRCNCAWEVCRCRRLRHLDGMTASTSASLQAGWFVTFRATKWVRGSAASHSRIRRVALVQPEGRMRGWDLVAALPDAAALPGAAAPTSGEPPVLACVPRLELCEAFTDSYLRHQWSAGGTGLMDGRVPSQTVLSKGHALRDKRLKVKYVLRASQAKRPTRWWIT